MSDTNKITASFKLNGNDHAGVPVINPGDWFGKTWLLSSDFGHWVVEADTVADAIDELVESSHGEFLRITGSDRKDYGSRCSAGDIIGGLDITEDCWVNLLGEVVTDESVGRYLLEPNYTGTGIEYDDSNLAICGAENRNMPFRCLYHGEGIPMGGLTPVDYQVLINNEDEIQKYLAGLKNLPEKTVGAFAQCYEEARKTGESAGFERAVEFHDEQVGGNTLRLPGLLQRVVAKFAGLSPDVEGDLLIGEMMSYVNKARFIRDPRCHIAWGTHAEFGVVSRRPAFVWHNDEGDGRAESIRDCPEETRFTFERLLAEEMK